MRIGIFARTFERGTLGETLDAVQAHGLDCIQFNMECAGVAPMPDRIEGALCDAIRDELSSRRITMVSLSGTFNMIHPDTQERQRGLARLREMAASSRRLGASVITLCTGTRDPGYMWRAHPDNASPEAWRDVVVSMGEASRFAEEYDVTLAFEPEVSNVVDSARKARLLLDEIRSPRLKIVMDGANLYHAGELPRMGEILREAFDLLGEDIALAHAKDLDRDGEAGHLAAGTGLLDYDLYVSLLRASGFDGALLLHGLEESQVDGCRDFLIGKLSES
jgi:sugar phosphate isomerase/epimerase